LSLLEDAVQNQQRLRLKDHWSPKGPFEQQMKGFGGLQKVSGQSLGSSIDKMLYKEKPILDKSDFPYKIDCFSKVGIITT